MMVPCYGTLRIRALLYVKPTPKEDGSAPVSECEDRDASGSARGLRHLRFPQARLHYRLPQLHRAQALLGATWVFGCSSRCHKGLYCRYSRALLCIKGQLL